TAAPCSRSRRAGSGRRPARRPPGAQGTRRWRGAGAPPGRGGRRARPRVASQPLRVVLVLGLEALVAAEERMLRHVRRVGALGRGAAEGLRDRADVMRAGAAADAEVGDPELERLAREVPELVARADERIEPGRERSPARRIVLRVAKRLEGRLLVGRA